jgi:acetoacetyl-CoA synthetase
MYPGVWRHGDWLELTPRGSGILYGRSDATINRGGVRMGSAELYRAVLTLDEVTDALVVDLPGDDGVDVMPMFVVLAEGAALDDPP